jgi:aminopeptidase N
VRSRLLSLALVVATALLGTAVAQDRPYGSAPDRPFEIEHIALDLDVDLAGKAISGHAIIRVAATRDLSALRFDAVGLEVSSVETAKTTKVALPPMKGTFATDGEHLDVNLALQRGDKAQIKVVYSVRDPKAGLHFYGPTNREPDVPRQVWSQGEARTNRYWFPCVDNPRGKQTTELTAHVPAGFEALSNGSLVEKADEANGKVRFHWSQTKPHVAYLVTLVVGKFHVEREEWRGKPLIYMVPEKNKADVARSFASTKAMLDFFSDKIGVEYAWDKYAQVVVEQFGWGGMENTSATTLNERTLHDEKAHLDYDSEGLVSHELAHQWWGDLLTCHDWAHIWLNEGFASYFEALWDEKKNGQDEFEYNLYEKSHGARDGNCRARPVVDTRYGDPESVFDSRAYPKGAWVLHGLRKRVGDEAFWRSIQSYAKAHLYQNVETIDLRRAFEKETGESLARYFYDLTERPGHPALDVGYDWREEDKVLEVTIKQTQPGEAYAFRCGLAFGDDPKASKRVNVVFENEKEKHVVLPMAARPAFVRFDVDEAVLKDLTEHKGEDQWLVQVEKDPHPIGRIRAVLALAQIRSPRAIEALAKAATSDAFWAVSSEAAKALGSVGGEASRDALLKAAAHANPKVRRSAVEALAAFRRDGQVEAALAKILDAGDASYYVEAQAVASYAAIRGKDARARLEKALAKGSHNEVIRENAIAGLAGLEDTSVLPLFERFATEPGNLNVRRTALASMGRIAALPALSAEARQKTVDRLVKFVEEEGLRLRWAAIDALSAIGKDALTALPALDQVTKSDGEGRVRDAAKRAADRIRAGTPPDKELSQLRDEVQRLKESEERLIRRLERVEAKKGDAPAPQAPAAAPAKREPD